MLISMPKYRLTCSLYWYDIRLLHRFSSMNGYDAEWNEMLQNWFFFFEDIHRPLLNLHLKRSGCDTPCLCIRDTFAVLSVNESGCTDGNHDDRRPTLLERPPQWSHVVPSGWVGDVYLALLPHHRGDHDVFLLPLSPQQYESSPMTFSPMMSVRAGPFCSTSQR